MKKDEVQFKLRMPSKIHQEISALALKYHRSNNGQIIFLLETALAAERNGLGGLDGLMKIARNM